MRVKKLTLVANRLKRFLPTIVAVLCAVHFLACPSAVALAAVVFTGSVSPSDPLSWTSSTVGTIGVNSGGTATVADGGVLWSSNFYVGLGGTGVLNLSLIHI